MTFKIILSFIASISFMFSAATAQDVTYTLSDVQQFKIDGDSNVRSWDADINSAEATLVLTGVENLTLENLTPDAFASLDIVIAVSGIESDSGRLTSNLQGYLKKDDHPEITFNLSEVTSVEIENGKAVITAEGVVNAAGVDSNVTMNVDATINDDGTIRFVGTQDLLMTSFNVDPPTAMMGTIRSDDEIQILFDVTFSNQ